jgi:NADH-quinone oxidoreductase subunit G
MPKLIIDDLEIEVAPGTKVIAAAEQLGIMIPRFCYHPGLGSVGACRMCAVKFLQGPVKGLQMSCMVEAKDEMVVSSTDEDAVDFRKHVIEWLMLHHPHDCPVCDEGGHCLLQDETVSGGHGIRRYRGKKRTYRDQYLGVFVQHEMNRCIHCYRCRRFYQDFAGYRDLGAMQIANRVYFGRYSEGPLQSPFAGNLIDVCPTGVYTDKPSRFKGRRWDFERGSSLCIHCSLGCRTVASARYREVVRLEAGFSEAVNGYFICDRGRYGFYYTNHSDRPRHARIAREEVGWEAGILRVAAELARISEVHGPAAIASLGSMRSSLETQGMLKHLCNRYDWRQPSYFIDPGLERKAKQAVCRLDERVAVSLREIERADLVLAVGVDPVNEAPMLALAMRQAFRNGAAVAVIDPRPVVLPFDCNHLAVPPWDMERCLGLLAKRMIPRSTAAELGPAALVFYDALAGSYTPDAPMQNQIAALTEHLRSCRRPVVLCGTDIVPESIPAFAADTALLLRAAKQWGGLFYVLTGANAFGAALLTSAADSFEGTLEAIENGTVKALLVVENDPFRSFPDRERLEQAIKQLDLLLVLDHLPSETARRAHALLPTSTLFETGSCFINQEGRAQFADVIHHGGIPISQMSAGSHPPRVFQPIIPGGEPRPAWQALAELAHAMSPQEKQIAQNDLWASLAGDRPALAGLADLARRSDGLRIIPAQSPAPTFSLSPGLTPKHPPENQLQMLLVDWIFGTEELSGYSSAIQQVEKEPCLFMHAEDAARALLSDGDQVAIHLDSGSLQVKLCVSLNMARGVVVLPRHRQLAWQKLRRYPVMVNLGRMEKVQQARSVQLK